MILENHLDVPADPDAVFALVNDVQRVAGCLPGAALEGRDGEAYRGRVTVKVGPVKAAYAGTLRFTEVCPDERRLRFSARASDAHGAGDAEADVELRVSDATAGAALDLHTDLVIRGKIAQFGKGAITAVSGRLLDQFARNLAAELAGGGADDAAPALPPTAPPAAPAGARDAAGAPLDGLAMLLPPRAGRYAALAAAVGVGMLQGWLLGRLRGKNELIEELRRARR